MSTFVFNEIVASFVYENDGNSYNTALFATMQYCWSERAYAEEIGITTLNTANIKRKIANNFFI